MVNMKKINWKLLIVSLLIPIVVGGIATLLIKDSINIYDEINKPFFAPPAFLFGVVWGILYILMGVSLYMVLNSGKSDNISLWYFGLQLLFNFVWPIIFFNCKLFWLSFVWLLILDYLVVMMIISFKKINKTSAYLQIPYAVWIAFATILNLAIAILN